MIWLIYTKLPSKHSLNVSKGNEEKWIIFFLNREMVNSFNLRIKTWSPDSCIADVLFILIGNFQYYYNYANNYGEILNTIDKLYSSNPFFRGFLLKVDNTHLTNIMT